MEKKDYTSVYVRYTKSEREELKKIAAEMQLFFDFDKLVCFFLYVDRTICEAIRRIASFFP